MEKKYINYQLTSGDLSKPYGWRWGALSVEVWEPALKL